jgi:hypothetical protein
VKFGLNLICLVLSVAYLPASYAQSLDDVTVYIECTPSEELQSSTTDKLYPSLGTGVLVSEQGHVLTARHVVPDGYKCKGVPKDGSLSKQELRKDYRSVNSNLDAILLKFSNIPDEPFPSVKYCKLNKMLKGMEIIVQGFPSNSNDVKQPSLRKGEISTTEIDGNGMFQTSAPTIRGMSGGPVVLANSSNLVGIIAGAPLDEGTDQPSYWAVLAAESIASTFNLVEAPSNICLGQTSDNVTPKDDERVRIQITPHSTLKSKEDDRSAPLETMFSRKLQEISSSNTKSYDLVQFISKRETLAGKWEPSFSDGKSADKLSRDKKWELDKTLLVLIKGNFDENNNKYFSNLYFGPPTREFTLPEAPLDLLSADIFRVENQLASLYIYYALIKEATREKLDHKKYIIPLLATARELAKTIKDQGSGDASASKATIILENLTKLESGE